MAIIPTVNAGLTVGENNCKLFKTANTHQVFIS